jgi:hypothetical protein
METMWKIVSKTLMLAALAWLLLGALYLGIGKHAIADTVVHSRQIQSAFVHAADYVDAFHVRHGRLPNGKEFSTWEESQPDVARAAGSVTLFNSNLLPESHNLGLVPPGSYMLGFWRGEGWEFFAGWSRKSTLVFDEGAYYFSGSLLGDVVSWLAIWLVLTIASIWIGPHRSFKRLSSSAPP